MSVKANDIIILISVYRPPNSDASNYHLLCSNIYSIVLSNPWAAIYCAGDLNLPDICWNTNSVSGHRYPIEINNVTLDLVSDCGFTQMVELPPRGSNLLDLLFTNRPTLIHQSVPVPGIGDHHIILTTFQMKVIYQENAARKIYLWNSLNQAAIKDKLLTLNNHYTTAYTEDIPVEHLWNVLHYNILDLMDKYIPSKIIHKISKQPWINRNINQLRRHKQRYYNKARSTNSTWLE